LDYVGFGRIWLDLVGFPWIELRHGVVAVLDLAGDAFRACLLPFTLPKKWPLSFSEFLGCFWLA
jgi:hypothetical protein